MPGARVRVTHPDRHMLEELSGLEGEHRRKVAEQVQGCVRHPSAAGGPLAGVGHQPGVNRTPGEYSEVNTYPSGSGDRSRARSALSCAARQRRSAARVPSVTVTVREPASVLGLRARPPSRQLRPPGPAAQ
jgi:hypothetical protein